MFCSHVLVVHAADVESVQSVTLPVTVTYGSQE